MRQISARRLAVAQWGSMAAAWTGMIVVSVGFAWLIGAEALSSDAGGWWALLTIAIGLFIDVAAGLVWRISHRVAPLPELDEVASFVPEPPPAPSYDIVPTLLLVIDTSRYSPRTVERVWCDDAYYRHEVIREFEVPALPWRSPSSTGPLPWQRDTRPEMDILVPVMRIARGVLIDNLEVSEPGGGRISTLNIGEYQSVVRDIVERSVFALSGTRDLEPNVKIALNALLQQVRFAHAGNDDEAWTHEGAALDLLDWILALEEPNQLSDDDRIQWKAIRFRLYEFLDAITDAHIVFAPMSARSGDRVLMRYAYTTPHHPTKRVSVGKSRSLRLLARLFLDDPSANVLGLRDNLRYWLGLRPHEHKIPIIEHRWSQSYHLDFLAPQETYVYSCDLELTEPGEEDEPPGSIISFPHDGSRGCDYAHVYIRETSREELRERRELHAAIDCREKPPGMLGSITLVAVAEAVLIWVVGWRIGDFYGSAERGSDVPTLLFALPGIIAGFLGAQFTGEKLRSTSLSTVIGVLGCGLLAIGSTGLGLSKTRGDTFGGIPGLEHPLWFVLMILSALLAGDLLIRGFIRTRRYVQRINLPGDERTIVL